MCELIDITRLAQDIYRTYWHLLLTYLNISQGPLLNISFASAWCNIIFSLMLIVCVLLLVYLHVNHVLSCSFTLMLRTWELDPDKRPSFNDIATILTNLTAHGKGQRNNSLSPHTSDVVKATAEYTHPLPDNGTSEETSHTNITSPVYTNFPPREQMIGANFLSAVVPQTIPEEYEVPLSTRNSSVEDVSLSEQPLYEVPLSTHSNSNGSIDEAHQPLYEIPLSSRSNSNESATEEEKDHVYHTLEPQEA